MTDRRSKKLRDARVRARAARRGRVAPGRAAGFLEPPLDPLWALREENYEPALEHEVESRFAISNGLIGVRASLEQPARGSRPRTYVAGFFGQRGAGPRALLPGPDWSRFRISLDGDPVTLESGRTLTHSRTVDLRRGLLLTHWAQRLPSGHTVELRTLRLASLASRYLGLQLAEIRVQGEAAVTLNTDMDAPSPGAVEVSRDGMRVRVWRTKDGRHSLAIASKSEVRIGRRSLRERDSLQGGRRQAWSWDAHSIEPATFVRTIAVARDGTKVSEVKKGALASIGEARRAGPSRLVAAHTAAWGERWDSSDVVIAGDAGAQRALRFALYHLNSAANPEDSLTSIGARALTGDAYLGHVFWDTDIFLLPFYIFTWPAAARSLLMYRYNTLPAARAKAAVLGYRGALYAWESADTGEETTPSYAAGPHGEIIPIRSGTQEQHISADVAYAVWRYWQATHDIDFLLEAGAEILMETARFWASRAKLKPDGRYHIRGVIGPDEYHEEIDDNAYTNVMAQRNLQHAHEAVHLLERRWPQRCAALRRKLRLRAGELDQWADIARGLVVLQDPDSGLIEQFAGFFQCQPVDLSAYEPREAPMDVLLGRDQLQRSQVIKQGDVVMLLALLWERFSPQARKKNFAYYEPRCGHGSSLSPPIHALVAARLGDPARALRYFRETAAIDLDDSMGNAAGGIHIGALGGLWQATVFGFAGVSLMNDGIAFEPHLPQQWDTLSFPLQWRGRRLRAVIERKPLTVRVTLERGRPLVVRVGDQRHRIARGETWSYQRRPDDKGWAAAR